MESITLDGAQMLNRRMAHDHLAQQLQFPDYYGRNLDALYDLLSERSKETQLVIWHKGTILSWLGDYGEALCQTMEDAARANPLLEILYLDE